VNSDQVFGIIMTAIVASTWAVVRLFRGPLGDALARRLGGGSHGGGEREGEQEGQLAEMRARMAELEERLDFTERVLLQERRQSELEPGGRS
jgi:hypothetical protein